MTDRSGEGAARATPTPTRRDVVRWLVTIGGASALVVLVAAVAGSAPIPPMFGFLVAYAAVCGTTIETARAAPLGLGRLATLGALLFAALGAKAAQLLATPAGATPAAAALVTAALLAGGTALGASVGSRIEHPGHMIVVAVVSLVVDAFSVLHEAGPSAQIARSQALMSMLVLPWPILGTNPVEIPPILGVGDVAFAGIYCAATRVHKLSVARTVVALGVGFAASLGALVLVEKPTPVLPFLGLAVVAAQPAMRKLPPKDRRAALLGLVMLVVVLVSLLVGRVLR